MTSDRRGLRLRYGDCVAPVDEFSVLGRVTSVGSMKDYGHYRVWNFLSEVGSRPLTSGVEPHVGDLFVEGMLGSTLVQISAPRVEVADDDTSWREL